LYINVTVNHVYTVKEDEETKQDFVIAISYKNHAIVKTN